MGRFSACFLAVAAMSGCAGHPQQPVASAPRAIASAPPTAGQTAASADAKTVRQVPVDASNAADVQAAGYKIVNKDGEKLYCRKDPITGSRVQFQTTCLTAQELFDQQHQAQNAMSLITNQQTPVQGGLVGK
jgi:hypothetical protein